MVRLPTFRLIAVLSATVHVGQTARIPDPQSLLADAGVSGGVAVHVGCGSGSVLAEWGRNPALIAHGLDTNEAVVARAKARLDSLGLYGRISAECYDGQNLPYAENMINVILVSNPGRVTAEECERVLAPGGAVYVPVGAGWRPSGGLARVEKAGRWIKYRKQRPNGIDDWPQFLHDSSNNAVSHDRKVGDPHHLQWYAGPEHTRHHDTLASMSAMTSSGGRVFYIYDEGDISVVHQPPDWKLIARDAFNGMLLWKRDIPDWMTHLYNFRAGPTQLPRRLVSVGDRVFVTLGFTAPVEELDAATGRTLRTYEGSAKAEELVYHDGALLVVTGEPEVLNEKADGCYGYWEMAEDEEPTVDKTIKAYDTTTGRERWRVTGANLRRLVPLSLCALADSVFYLDGERLHCLDAASGSDRWSSPFPTEGWFIRSYAPTVVAHDDVVICLYWNRSCGFSIADGRQLWEQKGAMGFGSPADLFVIDGKAWTLPQTKAIWRGSKTDDAGIVRTGSGIPPSEFIGGAQRGTAFALDLHSGEIVDTLTYAPNQHHHRCHRDKATERYLLLGYSGVQLVDPRAKTSTTNQWVRGLCQYGFMPANGLLYFPPDPCRCKTEVKVNGFVALAESRGSATPLTEPVIEKGPLFERAGELLKSAVDTGWPTYRGDVGRRGAAAGEVPASAALRWQAQIGASLTAPVVAASKVLVAEREGYAVHCVDAKTGARLWKHLADGPVDSPPTLVGGLCVFGSAEGSVTCLALDGGKLVWRFRLPEHLRRIGCENRLESPLPIHGAVLVLDDVVYFAAGRSSHLDGGIQLYGLDLRTGQPRYEARVASEEGKTEGALADILMFDGTAITMRDRRFDRELRPVKGRAGFVALNGLLDGSWFDRSGWRAPGLGGKLVVEGPAGGFSVSNRYSGLKQARKKDYRRYNQDGHFHIKFTRYKEEFYPLGTEIRRKGPRGAQPWSIVESLQPRAMVLAGKTLCVAGWRDVYAIETGTGRARTDAAPERQSILRLYAASTGERLAKVELGAPPVYDGMAAADGNLFLSLRNGTLVCVGQARSVS